MAKTNFDDFDAEWESLLNSSSIPNNSNSTPKGNHPQVSELQASALEESSESETEDEFQEINVEDLKLNGINEKFNTLLLQMDEIRQKYIKELELRRKAEITNKELLMKIADLEEDNVEYQGFLSF